MRSTGNNNNDLTFPVVDYSKYKLSSDETELLNNLRKENKKLEQKVSKLTMQNIENKIADVKSSIQMLNQVC